MKSNFNIFLRAVKWLYPGMRVKRWLILFAFAVLLTTFGMARFLIEVSFFNRAICILAIILGVFLGILGLRNILASFIAVFLPQGEKELVDIIYRKRYLEKGPRIVAIGGGTGLSVLLQGIKEYTSNTSAIGSMPPSNGTPRNGPITTPRYFRA